MDILSPQLIWIGGRCYRVNPTHDDDQLFSNNRELKKQQNMQYTEDDLYGDEDADEDDYDIVQMENNRYKTSYHVPQVFFAQIIGSKGMTKRRIEAETKTQITIPKPGVEGDIIIVGGSHKNVAAARRKIDLIVLAARNKHPFTHFLCVPLTSEEIKMNFKKFKQDILMNYIEQSPGVEESLFQNSNKLHLTIATLSLMDNNDRVYAAEILQECKETVIEPILAKYGRINLTLKGLEYMNDDPSAVDILYGKVESEPMQLIADGISDRFIQKGLMQKKYTPEKVKLHVTLITSLFREDYDPSNPLLKSRQTFDARNILEVYRNYEFGVQSLDEIHLSQRYSTANDGFYEATGIILV